MLVGYAAWVTKTWLIIGAGYTGGRLAQRLAADGAAVVATHRSDPRAHVAGAPAGEAARVAAAAPVPGEITPLVLELDAPLPPLPAADVVVCCAPPGQPPGEREERLVAALRGSPRLLYVSSTGVYGPGHGQWIDEQYPLAPESESGRARVAAEERLRRAAAAVGLRCTLLRAAGIYGPGRGLIARVLSGEARVVGDGSAYLSRIHVEDLVAAILAAAEREVDGAINCGDDEPAPYGEVLDAVAAQLGLPPPPRVDPATVTPMARAMLLANRKIANRRLREELGVTLRYPSWRAALRQELAEQGRAAPSI